MKPKKPFNFPRGALATVYCNSLQGTTIPDASSGLFLAAPRRTGKSYFLREDLVPEMERRKWTTIYVDLWSDTRSDPALLIRQAIKAKLNTFAGTIAKLSKSVGLTKIAVFGALSMDMSALDLPETVTLADALAALALAGKAPVALVIDEAQQALESEEGINAMFALKSARDQLNQGTGGMQLFLVCTGSNRDKLSKLMTKKHPFFGSQVTKFKLLDRDFTDAYTAYINTQLAETNQFAPDDIFAAFKLVGHRPEALRSIINEIAVEYGAQQLGELLTESASTLKQKLWESVANDYSGLPILHQYILEVMVEQGIDYSPFSVTSMTAYKARSKAKKLSSATVQNALETLREKGFVWREAYGAYTLEDESLAHWIKSRATPLI